MKTIFEKGDRVRMSDEGIKAGIHRHQDLCSIFGDKTPTGVVVKVFDNGEHIKVWPDKGSTNIYHSSFWEKE